MKKRIHKLHQLCMLAGLIVLLAACATSSTPSTLPSPTSTLRSAKPSPTSPPGATQLRPDGPVPASCPVTPVYLGGSSGAASFASNLPWIQAQPTSSGIVAHLAYAGPATGGTYRLAPVNGGFKDGSYTKTFWTIDNPQASNEFRIDGTEISDPGKIFHDTGSAISTPGQPPLPPNWHQYTSYIAAPSVGCWRLQINSGGASGAIILWVAA